MTTRYTVADMVAWCDGALLQGDAGAQVFGLSIDSRAVEPGQLFAAIVGPNHDAHGYLAQAVQAGAGALLVQSDHLEDGALPANVPTVAVADTTRGIADLATCHRRGFEGTLVALTGSSGKTTTKEMIATVLETAGPCLKTRGNLNNDYGVPLTLLSRSDEHVRAVIELGMNHRGEIARLTAIAQPDVALVTNIGTAHIEFLGSQAEIAAEKGDLFAALSVDAVAVANWDDTRVREQSKRTAATVLPYGMNAEAEVRAEGVTFDPEGAFDFELIAPEGRTSVRVEGLGETTIINALAAAAAGVACGISVGEIARGLASYRGIAGRMSKRSLARGVTLIDDTYNANPQSMGAAIESLAKLAGKTRGVAVLGAMGELGDNADQAHRDAGRQVFEAGIEQLVTVGAGAVADGAVDAGMDSACVDACKTPEAALERLEETLREGDWVLVKGSRAAHMEHIVEMLSNEENR
ncbi:MAG: UDP-N-acetylmuramoyl-tripeptide--D-alanyl-D-alanine ligase [bacterium]|nr:UDP-N-acetylmuramoyl-tripeptide--D-alanyl-D-alanine ligase [bacterium]